MKRLAENLIKIKSNIFTPDIINGLRSDKIMVQAPVVQSLDNAIHRINRYPADKC